MANESSENNPAKPPEPRRMELRDVAIDVLTILIFASLLVGVVAIVWGIYAIAMGQNEMFKWCAFFLALAFSVGAPSLLAMLPFCDECDADDEDY